jgi:hypothetical protein
MAFLGIDATYVEVYTENHWSQQSRQADRER